MIVSKLSQAPSTNNTTLGSRIGITHQINVSSVEYDTIISSLKIVRNKIAAVIARAEFKSTQFTSNIDHIIAHDKLTDMITAMENFK